MNSCSICGRPHAYSVCNTCAFKCFMWSEYGPHGCLVCDHKYPRNARMGELCRHASDNEDHIAYILMAR